MLNCRIKWEIAALVYLPHERIKTLRKPNLFSGYDQVMSNATVRVDHRSEATFSLLIVVIGDLAGKAGWIYPDVETGVPDSNTGDVNQVHRHRPVKYQLMHVP